MQTSQWELQKALYIRLTNDTNLMNVITGVYDKVSSEAVKPYITIGHATVTPHATKSSYGENVVATLDVWSDYPGKKETIDIFNLILSALKEPLQIGGSFFMLRRDLVSMQILDDPIEDGVKHGVVEIRYYINN